LAAQWIAAAFSAVNAIRVAFYLPQIVAVARSVDGARDIALCTWAMWALTNAPGTAYGVVVVGDALLAASFALSMLACCAVIVLTLAKRIRVSRSQGRQQINRPDPACRATPARAWGSLARRASRSAHGRRSWRARWSQVRPSAG